MQAGGVGYRDQVGRSLRIVRLLKRGLGTDEIARLTGATVAQVERIAIAHAQARRDRIDSMQRRIAGRR